jgi:hypothetical protein
MNADQLDCRLKRPALMRLPEDSEESKEEHEEQKGDGSGVGCDGERQKRGVSDRSDSTKETRKELEGGSADSLAAKDKGMTITLTVLSTLAERRRSAEGENLSAVGGSSCELRILRRG